MTSLTEISSREGLAQKIKARILSGELAPGRKLDSVRAIAKDEKCSQPTVVRAFELLASEGYLIKQERKGVYVAEEEDWNPKSLRIGILTGVISSYSATLLSNAEYLAGMKIVQDRLVNDGNQVSIHGAVYYPRRNDERVYVPVRNLGLDTVDAIVVAGVYEMSCLCSLQQLKIPVIVYDLDASEARMDSAFLDDAGSAFDLTQKLIERGHKKIVFTGRSLNTPEKLATWSYDPCSVKRADGYRLAMKTKGLEAHVFHAETGRSVEYLVQEVLKQVPGVTAIVMQDTQAVSVAKKHNISVASWTSDAQKKLPDGIDFMAILDTQKMGEAVYDLLVQRLKNPNAPIQRRIIQAKINEK